jgi:hypothetical protein
LFIDETPIHGVRSALIVPILRQGKTAGLIHLHSSRPGFFDQASLEVTQTLASQAAVALGNVQRYQEQRQRTELLRRRAETLTKFSEVSHVLNFEQPVEQSLRTIANSIREATPSNRSCRRVEANRIVASHHGCKLPPALRRIDGNSTLNDVKKCSSAVDQPLCSFLVTKRPSAMLQIAMNLEDKTVSRRTPGSDGFLIPGRRSEIDSQHDARRWFARTVRRCLNFTKPLNANHLRS